MNQYRLGPYGFASSEPDEMEALQSDVMRFMAILGLCLMIIFALVQSLPQSSKSDNPVAQQTSASGGVDSTFIKEETDALKEEREAMYSELDRLQGQLSELDNEVAQKEVVKNQLAGEEEKLQEKIVAHGQQLKELERRTTIRQQVVRPIPKNKILPKRAQQAPQAVTISQKEEQPKPEAEVVRQDSVPEQKEGFTLRFQSSTALDYLVRQGEVQLLVQIGKQFLALQTKGASLAFHSSSPPTSFHEMEAHTVPVTYKRLLAASGIRVNQGQQRTWGVVLPSSIRTQINQTMAGHKGGELQIDRRGQVSYH